jgi:hypothetical protein
MHVCMCDWVWLCVYTHKCRNIFIYTYCRRLVSGREEGNVYRVFKQVHTRAHTHTHTHTHTHIRTSKTHTHTHTHTSMMIIYIPAGGGGGNVSLGVNWMGARAWLTSCNTS